MSPNITVRETVSDDVSSLCDLLNDIIQLGGTTAHEEIYTPEQFDQAYLSGGDVITCVTAEDSNGTILGFQAVGKHAALPGNWGDIGTFTHTRHITRGIGTALFNKTRALTTQLHLEALNATIRADNSGGLAYYNRMGFIDYDRRLAIPLKDGTKVDRVCKRFLLKWY